MRDRHAFILLGRNVVHEMKGSCLAKRLHNPEGKTVAMESKTHLQIQFCESSSGDLVEPQFTSLSNGIHPAVLLRGLL